MLIKCQLLVHYKVGTYLSTYLYTYLSSQYSFKKIDFIVVMFIWYPFFSSQEENNFFIFNKYVAVRQARFKKFIHNITNLFADRTQIRDWVNSSKKHAQDKISITSDQQTWQLGEVCIMASQQTTGEFTLTKNNV